MFSEIFLPDLRLNENNGISGFILTPESTTIKGMLPIFNIVFVMIAGVGFPSGVAGTPFIHLHLP
jgi:hypothetical protein